MKKLVVYTTFILLFCFCVRAELTVIRAIPPDGSTGVDINSRVVLVFDKNISEGRDIACSLNGTVVVPAISSKMATFILPCMDYSVSYQFHAPAGAFIEKDNPSNLSPEIRLTFTAKSRPQPEARLFDAIVSADSTGDYISVQAAINAAPEKRSKPWLIFVRNGVYNEVIRVPESKPYIHLIGENADSTIIRYKICCTFLVDGGYTGPLEEAEAFGAYAAQFSAGYVRGSLGIDAMAHIDAKNFYSENISYINLWGYEERNYPQALAVWCTKDRTAFYNCKALSYQDTWRTPSSGGYRQYLKNCLIEGNVDFIYDNGDVFFDSCQINIIKNDKATEEAGWIVAPSHSGTKWGYVFKDCSLSAEKKGDSIYLGRAWIAQPKAVFINLQLDDKVVLRPKGWDSHFGQAIPIIFADWGTRNADGSPVDLSQRNNWYWYLNGNDTVQGYSRQYLSDEQAATYTFHNVIPGSDAWRPDLMAERLPAPHLKIESGLLSWNSVPFAICYEIRYKGKFVCFTTENNYRPASAATDYQVRAVNEWGGRGLLSDYATGLKSTSPATAKIVRTEYFDLMGRRIPENNISTGKQLILRKMSYSDGNVVVVKEIR